MEDYYWIIVIISIYVAWSVIYWIVETIYNSNKYNELKIKFDNLEDNIKEREIELENDRSRLNAKIDEFNNEINLQNLKVKKDEEEINKMVAQKSMGFPWLADAFADYFALKDLKVEEYLVTKNHPAFTTAQIVREIKNEKKVLIRENKILSYKINYFQKLFPWLTELIAENEGDEILVEMKKENEENMDEEKNEDRVKNFLTLEEYRKLPSEIRNQKALDRYLSNRYKSKWAIGRDYEMYVGYLFEQRGYSIEYKGILDGFEDLGRDIIAMNEKEVCIVQCKYWAKYKEIHEKHIFQLFGTTMEYWIKNFKNDKNLKTFKDFADSISDKKLRPIFFTSTSLSEKAREMANVLGIEIMEKKPLGDFPRIKCNISGRDSEKIYHLPFDQQYDRTIINKCKGEFCASTVKEAEDAGFRRAFRHRFAK